ncbi:hypothetical protein NAT51_19135 [Flavobacterium amniphilum]|uniref:hypothetical protein n=1 Tax=Flavobacterium amniphilum TaxID=1834035 RepID=UPI00202A9BAF|nr:hypothetical protein [Flavobacterium amniphilum]MCL9807645.1 hypothetical protein [Flavobacterium amniphilum]
MWITRISLDLYGEDFSPGKFLEEVTDKIHVFSSNEQDDKKHKRTEEVYGFGSLSVLCPQIYGLQYQMAEYENWYFDFLDKNKLLIDRHNVNEINLFIEIFHDGGQLNFEIFSRELLKKAGLYNIAIPVSYYKLTTEEIIDMIKDTDIPQDRLNELIKTS